MRRSAATLAPTASRSTTAHAGSPGGGAGPAGAGRTSGVASGVVSGAVTLIALQCLSPASVAGEECADGGGDGDRDVAGQDGPTGVGAGGDGGGPAVDVGGQRGGVAGRESCCQKRAEDAGEDVPGAGRGEPGGRAPDAADGAAVAGDDERRPPLEQDGGPGRAGELADAGERRGLDVAPRNLLAVVPHGGQQPGELTGVRSEDSVDAEGPTQVGLGSEQGQRTRVDDAGQAGTEGVADGGRLVVVGVGVDPGAEDVRLDASGAHDHL